MAPFGGANPNLALAQMIPLVIYMGIVFLAIVAAWTWLIIRLSMGLPLIPRESKRIVPWGLVSVFIVFAFWLAAQIASSVLYRLISPPPHVAQNAGPPMGMVFTPQATPKAQEEAPNPKDVAEQEINDTKAADTKAAAETSKTDKPTFSPRDQLALVTVSSLLTLLFVPWFLRRVSGARWEDLGLRSENWLRAAALGIWLCFLMVPFVYIIQFIAVFLTRPKAHPIVKMIFETRTGAVALFALLAAAIVAPIVEELLFRGVLMGWLMRTFDQLFTGRPSEYELATETAFDQTPSIVGQLTSPLPATEPDFELNPTPASQPTTSSSATPWTTAELLPTEIVGSQKSRPTLSGVGWPAAITANIITSIIFAGMHYAQWPAPIPLFFLSLGLGFIYQCTANLAAPIAMHATFNSLSTIAMIIIMATGAITPEQLEKQLPIGGDEEAVLCRLTPAESVQPVQSQELVSTMRQNRHS